MSNIMRAPILKMYLQRARHIYILRELKRLTLKHQETLYPPKNSYFATTVRPNE